jgi:release factor glutamine methyltransferase
MNEREQMLTTILDCERVDLYADKKPLTPAQEEKYMAMLKRRSLGEPLQYIIGTSGFMGLDFKVNPCVLIPRPETEILVEEAVKVLKKFKPAPRILDLGTGSGNIAVSIAKFLDQAKVVAVDISKEALKLAEENAKANNVLERIEFVYEDMKGFLEKDFAPFDMIISNPPYIKTRDLFKLPVDVRREPELALDGGQDGLVFYRTIISRAPQLLRKNGFLFLEIGDNQDKDIKYLLDLSKNFKKVSFIKDYVGTNRVVVAIKN